MSVFNQFGAGVFIGHLKQGVINPPVMSGSASVLFSQAGIFAPSVYGGRTSEAYLEDGTEVNPEELRVATNNPASTVTRVDHADGIDYGYNSLGIEYQLVGDGPFYYLLEGGATNQVTVPEDFSAWNDWDDLNVTVDGDGYLATAVGSGAKGRYVFRGPTAVGNTYTISLCVEYVNSPYLAVRVTGGVDSWVLFNIETLVVLDQTHMDVDASIFQKNGRVFISITFESLFNDQNLGIGIQKTATLPGTLLESFVASGESFKFYYAQQESGSEATTFTPSTRTDDKSITIPNILPADNPQIRYIDSNGDVITEDAKTSALCSYNGTDTITVRQDTSVSAKIVIG